VRRISDEISDAGRRRIIFEHEWREDFVGAALTLEVDASECLAMMEFYSAHQGVVRWSNGAGIGVARQWEDDEAAGRGLAGPRAALLVRADPKMQPLSIIEAVLGHFRGTPLDGAVRAALAAPEQPHIIRASIVDLFACGPEPAAARGPSLPGRFGRAVRNLFTG
jgi:hypothetical protein